MKFHFNRKQKQGKKKKKKKERQKTLQTLIMTIRYTERSLEEYLNSKQSIQGGEPVLTYLEHEGNERIRKNFGIATSSAT
jgi:hypothetical protein